MKILSFALITWILANSSALRAKRENLHERWIQVMDYVTFHAQMANFIYLEEGLSDGSITSEALILDFLGLDKTEFEELKVADVEKILEKFGEKVFEKKPMEILEEMKTVDEVTEKIGKVEETRNEGEKRMEDYLEMLEELGKLPFPSLRRQTVEDLIAAKDGLFGTISNIEMQQSATYLKFSSAFQVYKDAVNVTSTLATLSSSPFVELVVEQQWESVVNTRETCEFYEEKLPVIESFATRLSGNDVWKKLDELVAELVKTEKILKSCELIGRGGTPRKYSLVFPKVSDLLAETSLPNDLAELKKDLPEIKKWTSAAATVISHVESSLGNVPNSFIQFFKLLKDFRSLGANFVATSSAVSDVLTGLQSVNLTDDLQEVQSFQSTAALLSSTIKTIVTKLPEDTFLDPATMKRISEIIKSEESNQKAVVLIGQLKEVLKDETRLGSSGDKLAALETSVNEITEHLKIFLEKDAFRRFLKNIDDQFKTLIGSFHGKALIIRKQMNTLKTAIRYGELFEKYDGPFVKSVVESLKNLKDALGEVDKLGQQRPARVKRSERKLSEFSDTAGTAKVLSSGMILLRAYSYVITNRAQLQKVISQGDLVSPVKTSNPQITSMVKDAWGSFSSDQLSQTVKDVEQVERDLKSPISFEVDNKTVGRFLESLANVKDPNLDFGSMATALDELVKETGNQSLGDLKTAVDSLREADFRFGNHMTFVKGSSSVLEKFVGEVQQFLPQKLANGPGPTGTTTEASTDYLGIGIGSFCGLLLILLVIIFAVYTWKKGLPCKKKKEDSKKSEQVIPLISKDVENQKTVEKPVEPKKQEEEKKDEVGKPEEPKEPKDPSKKPPVVPPKPKQEAPREFQDAEASECVIPDTDLVPPADDSPPVVDHSHDLVQYLQGEIGKIDMKVLEAQIYVWETGDRERLLAILTDFRFDFEEIRRTGEHVYEVYQSHVSPPMTFHHYNKKMREKKHRRQRSIKNRYPTPDKTRARFDSKHMDFCDATRYDMPRGNVYYGVQMHWADSSLSDVIDFAYSIDCHLIVQLCGANDFGHNMATLQAPFPLEEESDIIGGPKFQRTGERMEWCQAWVKMRKYGGEQFDYEVLVYHDWLPDFSPYEIETIATMHRKTHGKLTPVIVCDRVGGSRIGTFIYIERLFQQLSLGLPREDVVKLMKDSRPHCFEHKIQPIFAEMVVMRVIQMCTDNDIGYLSWTKCLEDWQKYFEENYVTYEKNTKRAEAEYVNSHPMRRAGQADMRGMAEERVNRYQMVRKSAVMDMKKKKVTPAEKKVWDKDLIDSATREMPFGTTVPQIEKIPRVPLTDFKKVKADRKKNFVRMQREATTQSIYSPMNTADDGKLDFLNDQ